MPVGLLIVLSPVFSGLNIFLPEAPLDAYFVTL